MLLGSYLPYKASQWFFVKTMILLKTYMRLFGKKPVTKTL
jgi:hypothetical protein